MLRESQSEIRDTEATFYCASTDSTDSCPKAEPQEQQDLTLYTLASRLWKQKARSIPYIVLLNSIGYFTPVLHDPLHVQIPQVLSLCNAIPTSLLLYQNSGPVCFLLALLPATGLQA
jgi:hypothetical protein